MFRVKMVSRPFAATVTALLAVLLTACVGSSGPYGSAAVTSTTSAVTSTSAGTVDPNAPEIVEPGDIPDNQVFVPFSPAGGAYSIEIPEGWARSEASGIVTFTDNYNSVRLQQTSGAAAPTIDSMKHAGLADVSDDPTFVLGDVTSVSRKAGDAILATYEIGSQPNPVTGKKALLAVERYEFFNNGMSVVVTLSGAKGADNVDPWRIVTDSLTWK